MPSTTTTVYAVIKETIEIPVRSSSPQETLEELQRVSLKEGEAILRGHLPEKFRLVGNPEFSHAVVRTA